MTATNTLYLDFCVCIYSADDDTAAQLALSNRKVASLTAELAAVQESHGTRTAALERQLAESTTALATAHATRTELPGMLQ